MFRLHSRLQKDTHYIGDLTLCRLLLIDDATYPWFLLVPRRAEITEIYQLSDPDQQQLLRESSQLSAVLARTFKADKMNVAALGNVVPQLHIHHIVRYQNDPAWPDPVWGHQAPRPYSGTEASNLIESIRQQLSDITIDATP
jgi:diadenosine tetraphosphate (Ap4A) HIT family hydrolase